MDLPSFISQSAVNGTEIETIEMHTTGEPTRIIYSGFPDLSGTLLDQRSEAEVHHDHIRRTIICEPRGHREMYGAVLRPSTELVDKGKAHVGVLFLTNDGYSTMCGHATLAISRLLVDQASANSHLFGLRNKLVMPSSEDAKEVRVDLHVPCGLVYVTVPITKTLSGSWKTDKARPISYLSVPSYATGISVSVPIPDGFRWPELKNQDHVVVDIAYGGAFYIIASPAALGFPDTLVDPDLASLSIATRRLKEGFNSSSQLRKLHLQHEEHTDLQFLYGTILTDTSTGRSLPDTNGAETSLCFFSDAQVDRSPTGSGVQAKVALACAKGERTLGQKWSYHSLVSNHYDGEGAFVGEAVEEVRVGNQAAVIVKVSGWARYAGASTFLVEEEDAIGKGFWFEELGRSS